MYDNWNKIQELSGLGRHFDHPVYTYSSGMRYACASRPSQLSKPTSCSSMKASALQILSSMKELRVASIPS